MHNAFLEETDLEVIPYMLKAMIKENKRYKSTRPFHGRRSCEDREVCAFHRRTR